VSIGSTTIKKKNLSLGRQRVKKEESVDWIDDAGLSLELADEQYKSVAGSTRKRTKESVAGTTMNERRASIGSTSRWKLGAPGKQPTEREGVGPLEQKECHNYEGVSMDEHGTEGVHLRVHVEVHL